MRRLNRRRFLARSAMAAIAGPALLPGAAGAIGPIGRTRPSHLKLSLAGMALS